MRMPIATVGKRTARGTLIVNTLYTVHTSMYSALAAGRSGQIRSCTPYLHTSMYSALAGRSIQVKLSKNTFIHGHTATLLNVDCGGAVNYSASVKRGHGYGSRTDPSRVDKLESASQTVRAPVDSQLTRRSGAACPDIGLSQSVTVTSVHTHPYDPVNEPK